MSHPDARKYELLVLLSGELTEGDFEKEVGEIRKLLKESVAEVPFEHSWGRRELSYRLKKQNRGFYVSFILMAQPEVIKELNMTLKLNPLVLRHLLLSVPEEYNPAALLGDMMQDRRVYDKKVVRVAKGKSSEKQPMAEAMPIPAERAPAHAGAPKAEKPMVAGKAEEEKLKKVEKKLEQILDNPDIDVA